MGWLARLASVVQTTEEDNDPHDISDFVFLITYLTFEPSKVKVTMNCCG